MTTVDRLPLMEQISELHALGIASIAALSSVRIRVEEDVLHGLIEEYLDVARSQVRRLRELPTGYAAADFETPATGLDDLRHFARELARGLLSNQFELAAANALLRLADRKLELYQFAGDALAGHEAAVRAVLGAGEAEEAGMVESLIRYRDGLRAGFAQTRTA